MSVTQGSGVTLQPGVSAGADDRVATPVFSPAAGAYGPAQSVTITCSTPGASIKYTTDGSTPSPSHGTAYTVPVAIAATATLKALAYDGVLPNSAVRTGVYTIGGTVATPVITLAAGTYDNAQTTTLTCATGGAAIHYTVDGSQPTTLSPLYSVALNITSSRTIKAKAFKTGYTSSATASSVFVLQVATPTFTPVAGTYSDEQSVTIATATAGAALHYSTTSDSGPWTDYATAVSVAASETLYAYGSKAGYSNSAVGSAAYVISVSATRVLMDGTTIRVLTDGTTERVT